jgi:hypothetical protein
VLTVAPSAPQREPVHMSDTATLDPSGDLDLTFDFEQIISAVDYSRIMRRIGIDGDETIPQVSAFNSSI